jgi:S1-C subfamily serine protease
MTASVVAFDPARDAAVLAVPGLALPPLQTAVAKRGTQSVILGYPGGGPETSVAAVVQGEIRGEGRDIYDQTVVNRDILVLSGRARPGNSGGPLVDLEGRMIGLVFAGSISRPDQSYALALGEVLPAIEAASTSAGRLDMRTYQCVS